jgi:hypothetical protein
MVLLLLQMAVFAQSERGAIVGLVTDSTGALVAEVMNAATCLAQMRREDFLNILRL